MDGRSRPVARATRPRARHRRRPLAVSALAAIALNLAAAPAAAQEPGLTDGLAAVETTILYPEPTVVPTILDPTETNEPTVTPTILDPTETNEPTVTPTILDPTETNEPTVAPTGPGQPPAPVTPQVSLYAVLGQCSVSGGERSIRWFVYVDGALTETGLVENLQLGGVGAGYLVIGDLREGAQLQRRLFGEQYLPDSRAGDASMSMTIRYPSGTVQLHHEFELSAVCPFAVAEQLCPDTTVRVGFVNTTALPIYINVDAEYLLVPARATEHVLVPTAITPIEVHRNIGGEGWVLVGAPTPEPVGDCGPPPAEEPVIGPTTQPTLPMDDRPPAPGPIIGDPAGGEPVGTGPTATATPPTTPRPTPAPSSTQEAILIADPSIDPDSPWFEAFCLSIAGVSAAALALLAWYLRRRPSHGDA